jgi:hypothetical protein
MRVGLAVAALALTETPRFFASPRPVRGAASVAGPVQHPSLPADVEAVHPACRGSVCIAGQSSPALPWFPFGALSVGVLVASFAAGGSDAHVDPRADTSEIIAHDHICFSSLQAERRALLEEDEASSHAEFQIVSEKLKQEDSRLMMLVLDAQLKEVRDKMANVAFDAETYAKKLPGILPFLGYFDPLGFSTKVGVTEEQVKFYREAELKHGRLGTLAAFGIVVSENFHPLGGDQMNGVPAILAFQNSQLFLGTALILATIALPDVKAVPLLSPTDEVKQTTELNGTRVGMLAATSMIAKEMATSKCLMSTLAVATPDSAAVSTAAAAVSQAVSEAAAVSTALAEAI